MDRDSKIALAKALREISDSLARLSTALEGSPDAGSQYGPAHTRLPWSERVLRQSLIIQDIVAVGGVVTKDEWYEIAARYGYAGRGLAGFFRGGSQGLLEMRKSNKVAVTKHGRDRLAQNLGRVEAARAEEVTRDDTDS